MTRIIEHPFKEAVRMMLRDSFSSTIANSFYLSFEAEHISSKDSIHIFRQLKTGNLVMEVRYKNPDGTFEYICDLFSWDRPVQVKAKLLRFITDKYKAGKIKGWVELGGKISKAVVSGKYETPNTQITNAMIRRAIMEQNKKGGEPN